MIRIVLFLLTNLAVMVIFGIILHFTGAHTSSIARFMIMAGIFGFGGSFVALFMSKSIALRLVGGEIIEQPRNETERWLLYTVNQQAQKTNIVMPQIAIYHAADINAFATGHHRNASLIAISTGLLQSMNRDEAEAVIAHETSHIANGDMVTITLIQGVVNTFVMFISRILAQLAAGVIPSSSDHDNDESKGNPMVYSTVAMVLELVFGVLASMIILWFSRYREFNADAGSAKLVGKEKMIAALERLKTGYAPQEDSRLIAFCIHGPNKTFSELFMSHPPLDKRIEALRSATYQ